MTIQSAYEAVDIWGRSIESVLEEVGEEKEHFWATLFSLLPKQS